MVSEPLFFYNNNFTNLFSFRHLPRVFILGLVFGGE